jgi:hypothetical protein
MLSHLMAGTSLSGAEPSLKLLQMISEEARQEAQAARQIGSAAQQHQHGTEAQLLGLHVQPLPELLHSVVQLSSPQPPAAHGTSSTQGTLPALSTLHSSSGQQPRPLHQPSSTSPPASQQCAEELLRDAAHALVASRQR